MKSAILCVVSLVCWGSYTWRIVENPTMFCLIEDSCDCLCKWGILAESRYLSWRRSASVIVVTAILSAIFVFLTIVSVVLSRDL